MIRIANGQGFWGDWLEAPVRLVEQGPIDYLILDYLAEVTMSILQKQKDSDPELGYARDFPPLIGRIGKQLLKRETLESMFKIAYAKPEEMPIFGEVAQPGIRTASRPHYPGRLHHTRTRAAPPPSVATGPAG